MYIKANSKKICEAEYLFLFSRKMLMSAFLLSFKVNNLEEMRGHPNFSLWIPIARAKIYFFRMVSIMVSIPLYSVSTDLKASLEIWRYVISFMLGSGAIRVWGMCQPRTTTMKLLVSRFFLAFSQSCSYSSGLPTLCVCKWSRFSVQSALWLYQCQRTSKTAPVHLELRSFCPRSVSAPTQSRFAPTKR